MHTMTLAAWVPAQIAGMVLASLLAIAVLMALVIIAREILSPALEPAPVGVALRQMYMRGEISRKAYLGLITGIQRVGSPQL